MTHKALLESKADTGQTNTDQKAVDLTIDSEADKIRLELEQAKEEIRRLEAEAAAAKAQREQLEQEALIANARA